MVMTGLVVVGCLALPCAASTQTGGSTASLGALGPAACSPTSLLSGAAPGTAGSASARAASLKADKVKQCLTNKNFV